MLKVRLMGTPKDIQWFQNLIVANLEIEVLGISDIYTNRGTERFFRAYMEINKPEKERENKKGRKSYGKNNLRM